MPDTNARHGLKPIARSRRSAKEAVKINLDFRPETYFWPLNLQTYLLSHVKGAARREALRTALASNELDEIMEVYGKTELPDDTREKLFRMHPAFLGGEFLPEREENEVEIARITISSTTFDVTSVYVRFVDGLLHYRVVDEYEGATLTGPAIRTFEKPLTLGELVEFLDSAWPIVAVLEMGFEGNLRYKLGCFEVESGFYPQINALYKRREGSISAKAG